MTAIDGLRPSDETIGDRLAGALAEGGGRTAVVGLDGAKTTYDDLAHRVGTLVETLDERSVGPGPVCVQMAGSVSAVVSVVAALKRGNALAMVHPRQTPLAMSRVVDTVDPVAVLTDTEVKVRDGGHRSPDALPPIAGLQPAFYVLTSGSTGSPRAIVASHGQVATALNHLTDALGYRSEDVVAAVPPLSFDYGLYQVLLTLTVGGTLVLDPRLDTVQGVVRAVGLLGVTVLPVVPTFLRLLFATPLLERIDTTGVRLLTTTGDLLSDGDVAEARFRFPNAVVLPMYGLSECKRVAITDREEDRPAGSIGRPLPIGDVAVVDESGRRLAPGQPGELVVAGPHLTLGYLGDADATQERFPVDRSAGLRLLRTGDRVRLDDAGWLHWVGRSTCVIKTAGYRVDPAEIEAVVRGACVTVEVVAHGRLDDRKGQVPVAVAQVRPGISLEEAAEAIERAVAAELPRWAHPELELRAEPLAMMLNGKVVRPQAEAATPDEDEGVRPSLRRSWLAGSRQFVNCHSQALLSAFPLDISPERFELFTTVPFGVRSTPNDPHRLLMPHLDPDLGLDRAVRALGIESETRWFVCAAEALATLDQWLRTSPVLLGPLDLGLLPYHPLAGTLSGCDHYLVALGRRAEGVVVRDPEGIVQVTITADALVAAWSKEAVPEGRGSFSLRRLAHRLAARSHADVNRTTLAFGLDNLVAAARSPLGGASVYRALAEAARDATRQRALSLLVPPAAFRYRLASRFLAEVGGHDMLADAMANQAVRAARLASAVLGDEPDDGLLAELAFGEDRIAEIVDVGEQ